MNPFGTDYLNAGRNLAALGAIAGLDSDGDGFTNEQEVMANRLPGDKNDDYTHGQQLPGELHYLMAYERDGFPLQESKIVAGSDGKSSLEGEGPYRFISPLIGPVTPDRSQWTIDRDAPPYPYNPNRPVIRNGDYCIKAFVAIRVNTETNKSFQYDWSGRAWEMIENGELVIYGALSPK